LGRCVSASDNISNTVSRAYNSLSQCVRCVDGRGDLSGAGYDFLGRCSVVVVDLDGDGLLDFAADAGRAFTWDDNSRLVSLTDDNTNVTSWLRSEEHTSELQSHLNLVCRLLLEKKQTNNSLH